MNWTPLTTLAQLDEIDAQSATQPIVILKHSTRCSISHMAKARLYKEAQPQGILFYYLDLLAHRDVSNAVAARYNVHHESPQVLLIKNGACIFEESHNGISMAEIVEQAAV